MRQEISLRKTKCLQTVLCSEENPRVVPIDKKISSLYVKQFHYLSDRGSLATVIHGLVINGKIVGVAEWKPPTGAGLVAGAFGLDMEKGQDRFFELGRFLLSENVHNRASMFLGKSIKLLRRTKNPRAIFTFADTTHHLGIIYQATNWKYYGLSAPKTDAFANGKKCGWGKVKNVSNRQWKPRPRKHRYAIVYDRNLEMRWKELPYPKLGVSAQ